MLGLFGPKSDKIAVYKAAFAYQGAFRKDFSTGSPVINEVVLGVPVISFPCSPISLKERSLKGVSVFSVLLGLFGSLRAPVSGARDPLVGSYPCCLSPSPKPAEGCPPKAAASCSIRRLRNSCRNAWQKVML